QASALGTVRASGVDDAGLTSNVALASVTSVTPLITLTATPATGNKVTLTGHVTAPTASGLTVAIGGGASGATTTDALGNFNVTLDSLTAAAITAYTKDVWGETSNTASATPGSTSPATTPPTISNFSAYQNPDGSWTFSGQVNASSFQGLT